MSGLIGKKIGMTNIFAEDGKILPCTVVQAGPCIVTQVRTKNHDGYDALQLGFNEKSEKSTNKPELGHYKKSATTPMKKLVEFKGFENDYKLGDKITVEYFNVGEYVDVTGTSKGKGFQGVVKRHGLQELVKLHTDSITDYVPRALLVQLHILQESLKA